MCLVIPPAIVIAATVASAAAAATSSILSGVAKRKAAEANKELMDQQAAQVRAAGEVEAEKAAMQGSQLIGKQKAAASGSGADVQGRSMIDILSDSRWMSTWNRDAARQNSDYRANAFKQQGEIALEEGKTALLAAGLNAGGQLIGGAASAYGAAYKMGMFPTLSRGGDVISNPTAGMGDLNLTPGLS